MRLIETRQFGSCMILTLAIGTILIATTQFLRKMPQKHHGCTATWTGLALSPGGLVTVVMIFMTGKLTSRIQPNI